MSKTTIPTRGLSAGTLYKVLFVGSLFSLGPLSIIIGIFSIFGLTTVQLGAASLTGISGLLGSIVLAFLVPFVFATLAWIFLGIGLWIYTRMMNLNVTYKTNKVRSAL